MWYLKINIFQIFHQRFGNISLAKLWRMSKKGLMKGLPKHLPHFEDTQSIHLSNKAEKNPWVQPLIYQSFTLVSFFKCIFSLFNVKIISVFTSTFVATYSVTSYPFGFTSRRKMTTLDFKNYLTLH